MTRLSSYPFAKSLLALSISAVFSSAALAAQQVEFTDDYSVTINNQLQDESYSVTTNPMPTGNQWWGLTNDKQGNQIELSATHETGKLALVKEDVLGGWASAGSVNNNKIVVDISGSEKAIALSGYVQAGFSAYIDDVSVKDNAVELTNIDYVNPSNDEEDFSTPGYIMGGAAASLDYSGDGSSQNISVTNNSVSIKNSAIETALVAGGVASVDYLDNALVNNNRVIIDNVKGTETSNIIVVGGIGLRGNKVESNRNEVTLTNSTVRLVGGGIAAGFETQANNNDVKLVNVSANAVIGAMAWSSSSLYEDEPESTVAQAMNNRFVWKNNDPSQEFSLDLLMIAQSKSSYGQAITSGNYAELEGIKASSSSDSDSTVQSDSRFIMRRGLIGFMAQAYEDDAIVTENILKIKDSAFREVMVAGAGSGNQVFLSGNHTEIKNSQFERLGGYLVQADESAQVVGNSINVDGSTVGQLGGLAVLSRNSEISGNIIHFTNSVVYDVVGIMASSGYYRSVGDQAIRVTDNHIVFDNLSTFSPEVQSRNARITPKSYFLQIDDPTNAVIRDNNFEVVNVDESQRKFIGINLELYEDVENLDIQNNTLLVKDSIVDGVVGISVSGLENISEDQFILKNNTIILDTSKVGYVSSFGQIVQSQPKQNGTLVIRRNNEVGVAPIGFNDWQFDLDTAVGNTSMLTIKGSENVVLKDQTLVLNNADQANIDQISLIGMREPNVTLTADNVTLRTEGTFAFKSMALNGDLNNGSLELGQYYDTLMSQKTQADVSTRTLSDSQLATVALTRQTSEEVLNLLQSTENLSADAPMKGFATLSGSSNFYEFGTGFDLNGTSLTVGGTLRINDKWSGVGFANFSDANADSTVSGFRGDSDMKTYSAGVALRYQTEMPFYTEGALVVGQADTDFVGYYTNDTARYDTKRLYTTAQLGVGSDFALSDNVNLNVYGRYSFTYLDGDKVSLKNAYNDTFDVDDTMVHAMRVGARVKGSVAPNVQWFAGAAFERVLDGDVEAMVKDAKLKTETLKGNVGIFEVGATLAPNDLGPWTMDVKAGAYAGDRRGVSGSVSMNYVF